MASFFSLQPQQTDESNLSKFASGMPGLEHVGSNTSYLDPSLSGGETLHSPFEDEATQAKQGMAGSSIMQPSGDDGVGSVVGSGNQYQSNVTGTQFKTPSSGGQGSTLPSGVTAQQIRGLVNSTTGTLQKGLSGFGPEMTGQSAGGEQGISDRLRAGSITTDDYNQLKAMSPSDLDKFIQSLGDGSALQTSGVLSGTGQDNALQGFDLGADIQLLDPTTQQAIGSFNWGKAFQGGSTALGGVISLATGIQDKNTLQTISGSLQTIGGITKLAEASPALLKMLGLNESIVSQVSAVNAGAGALLGVYAGIQALKDGDIMNGTTSTLSGLVSGYSALQSLSAQFPEMFGEALPTLGQAAYEAINAISPSAANALKSAIGTGATSGLSSSLGVGASIGAAVSAILGLIASETGSKELGQAAAALGMAVSGVTTAVAVGAAVTTGTAFGTAAAASAGAALGVSVGAGAAMLPVAVMLLAFSIGNMIEPGSMPEISDIWTGGKLDSYMTFNKELTQNVGQQDKAFDTLNSALDYVQSKEELGQLINTYKNYLQTTTGIQLDDAMNDPYVLDAIPGVGSKTHGTATQARDFGPQQQMLQAKINHLLTILPGNEITAIYGQDGGGLTGEAARRLWQQFLHGDGTVPGGSESPIYGSGQIYSAQDISNAMNAGSLYNTSGGASATPIWDPATGDFVLSWASGPRPQTSKEYFAPYFQNYGRTPIEARTTPALTLYRTPAATIDPYALDAYGNPLHPESWGTVAPQA